MYYLNMCMHYACVYVCVSMTAYVAYVWLPVCLFSLHVYLVHQGVKTKCSRMSIPSNYLAISRSPD